MVLEQLGKLVRSVGRSGPRRHLSGASRVWILTVAIAAAAVVLYLTLVLGLNPLRSPVRVPWWLLAAMFYVAEVSVVHFRFRQDAHSFSMSEIPLVLGLFFAAPAALVPAQLLGVAAALILNRRQPLLKLTFNLSQFFLQTCLAVVVFHGVTALGDPFGPVGWLAALMGTQAAMGVADGLINAAIYLSGDRVPKRTAWAILGLGFVATTMNTSLALVGVTILLEDVTGGWLALVPPVVLFVAYRAYSSTRRDHERLEALYEATQALHGSPQLEDAMATAVDQASKLLDAQMCEIVLLRSGAEGDAYSTRRRSGEDLEIMVSVDLDLLDAFWDEVIFRRKAVLLPRPIGAAGDRGYLADRGVKDAVIAPLVGPDGVVGVMVVANRFGDVSTFDEQDLKLLETLAHHVSVSLENGRLEDSLAELTKLKEELRHQAFHDSLTKLPNRTLFTERVAYALARRDRSRRAMAVLFLDLDDFKTINDSLGHTAGDHVLITVARRLHECLRPMDTVARLGGDEFGILLEDMADPSHALVAAQRILDALAVPAELDGREVSIRGSLGITLDGHGDEADTLLRNADVAMYMAKRRGKGRYQLFESSMHTEMVQRLEMTAQLRRAVKDGEFSLRYQPIVNLETGRIDGVEALVRWDHPQRGELAPGEFIPLAEETGLIVPLGWEVLREACARAKFWQEANGGDLRPLTVSVNLSPKQLLEPNLVKEVARSLSEAGLAPGSLVLEITEDVLMQEAEGTLLRLRELKAQGVRLAIDDFGTGYSSLSYLERFPVDMLKIAKPFVDGLGNGSGRSPLVEAVIKLGGALGLQTVAEGIEREEQLDRLRSLHCEQGQGYYFAHPLTGEGIEALLGTIRAPDRPSPVAAATN
jgi:diguanylate cyclase (GGDEF)-like protein